MWGQSKKQSKTKLTKAAKKYKDDHGIEPEYKHFECLYSGEETGVIRVCGEVSEVIRKADKERYNDLQCPRCKSEGITERNRPPPEGKQKNKHWEVTDQSRRSMLYGCKHFFFYTILLRQIAQ